MSKVFKGLKLFVILMLVLSTFVISGCSGTVSVYNQNTEITKKEVTALEAQPEIDDPGEAFEFTVSGVFSDDMVLQRDEVIQVWGWSKNIGGYVYGDLLGETRYAQVAENGEWLIQFSPKEYSKEGTTLRIYTKHGEEYVFNNVLIGDVWIVSGQSNAQFMVQEMTPMFPEVYDEINENDNIRLFRQDFGDVGEKHHAAQKDVVNSEYCWTKTTKETVDPFSAVGYMFVNELEKNTDVPQGIVMSCLGGCGIKLFMDSFTVFQFEGKETHPNLKSNNIYNCFLSPFLHMSFQGILFYQGESDNPWADEYAKMLTDCVAGWRQKFDTDFKFYNIQCTSHAKLVETFPGLPGLRAAQLEAYYNIPDSYIISTLDVGYRERPAGQPEEDYAHTFNKKTIGIRAAQVALAELYGNEEYKYEYVSCPIPTEISWSSFSAEIKFENVGDGLKAYEGDLIGFKVMYDDGTVEDVSAEVTGKDTVEVDLPIFGSPIAVCYAYDHSALLEEANLVNSNDVPAPTFKFYTDDYIQEQENNK